jgi:hypothetical protein
MFEFFRKWGLVRSTALRDRANQYKRFTDDQTRLREESKPREMATRVTRPTENNDEKADI